MSTSSAIKAGQLALQQCQDSLAVLAAQSKANTVIADYNSQQLAQCAAQDAANMRDYNNRCDEARRRRDDWRNCWNRKYNDAKNWEEYYECKNCEGHQYAVRDSCNCGDPGWNCKRFSHWCKNTDERCRQEANEACGAQEPSVDCGPPPPKVTCALKEQNKTQVNVNCCPNISVIAGSDVNTSTINQQTDCLNQQKQKLLENTGAVPVSTPTPSSSTTPKPTPTPAPKTSSSTIIIIVVVVILLIISIIIAIIMFSSKSKPVYHGLMLPPRSPIFRPPMFGPPGSLKRPPMIRPPPGSLPRPVIPSIPTVTSLAPVVSS
jgi:hypothetical protein